MISPGELTVGMQVTVHSWNPRDVPRFDLIGGATTVTHVDTSYCGDVLTVEALSLPYVVLRAFSHRPSPYDVFRLDTRRANLMELSQEYVMASTKPL
jgi:hypothetical protein